MHAWRAAPAALAALTACQLPLDRATCPCAEGWFCCESSQLCVADRTLADEPECAGLPPTTYTNPVADAPVSNPAILRDGTTYYAYSDGFDLDRIHIMSSPDLVRWTAIGGALVAPVAWADSSGSSFTSPSVVRFDSNPPDRQLVLYFTAQHTGTGERCIGVATAEDPRGPFTAAAEPLICPAGGAQDPSFISGTEKLPFPQLVYRQNGGVIRLYNEVLTPDGLSVLSSDGRRLIFEASPRVVASRDRGATRVRKRQRRLVPVLRRCGRWRGRPRHRLVAVPRRVRNPLGVFATNLPRHVDGG
jgi:hypothetical protein